MTILADIFKMHATRYIRQYGQNMLPSQKKVMSDILLCRSGHLAGMSSIACIVRKLII